MAPAIPAPAPTCVLAGKFSLNIGIGCGAIQVLPWCNILSADNPVEVLNEHLSLQVGFYVPTKVSRERNKEINAAVLLASSRRLIFGRQVIAPGLTGKGLFAVK